MDYAASIQRYIALVTDVLRNIDTRPINELMNVINGARQRDAVIYIMGNGGSASTASHFANDFNKGISEHIERKFRFHCLNDNMATVMAIANDIGYDAVFEFQLRGIVTPNDVVIGISGSGNSSNIIKAVDLAKLAGAFTVGITGYDGGCLQSKVDLSVHVPVMSMQVTEDVHMVINHLMMAVFYQELCGIAHVRG